VVRIILTLAPIAYSFALFELHRKTKNRGTRWSAMIFSCLAGGHVLYSIIAAFGDGAVLFYTSQKWGEMDVAKHLAVSQVFGQHLMLSVMLGMWLRGRNVQQDASRSLSMEERLALVVIPSILSAMLVKVSTQFIMIIRNDQCLMAYEVLEHSPEIHLGGAAGLWVTALISVGYQGRLWGLEWKLSKRLDEERQNRENNNSWTPSPPEKS
jgi:hypothetical protein